MSTDRDCVAKRPLGSFLAANPYPGKFTDGLFFRDKMRAIHRIAPECVGADLLEIGGGQSGLSKLLYPEARVTNLDSDERFAQAPCNRLPGCRFVTGDATSLPFEDQSFDLVTAFDLLEHVEDDDAVAAEALRVLRPNGIILVTTPDARRWRYPYFRILKPLCPAEAELFARWGHVRRGYDWDQLEDLFGGPPERRGSFINPWLALSHDLAFSRLPRRIRLLGHVIAAPVSLVGWLRQQPGNQGTEIAGAWRRAR